MSYETRAGVACSLLAVGPGQRLPSLATAADDLGVGLTTVHSALATLKEEGYIKVRSRGHLGTFMVQRDLLALWEISGRKAPICALPTPFTPEFVDLANSISTRAFDANFSLQILFKQGSKGRIALLSAGKVDWIVVSESTARSAGSAFDFMLLGDYTFFAAESITILTRGNESVDGVKRVGVDPHSYDHQVLTCKEFPDASHIDVPYHEIPELLHSRVIDAAVWHRTTYTSLLLGGTLTERGPQFAFPVDYKISTRASIVYLAKDNAIAALVEHLFS